MNEESALERLQKITWEEEVAKVIKWESVQKLGKEKSMVKKFVKQRDAQEELERQVGGPLYNIAPLVVISLLKLLLSFECEEEEALKQGPV